MTRRLATVADLRAGRRLFWRRDIGKPRGGHIPEDYQWRRDGYGQSLVQVYVRDAAGWDWWDLAWFDVESESAL